MLIVNRIYPKLCHAQPGDVVQLLDDNGGPEPELYLVTMFWRPTQKKAKSAGHGMAGLYNATEPLFLVDLATGHARNMVHLSSRVNIIRDAQLVVPGHPPQKEGE